MPALMIHASQPLTRRAGTPERAGAARNATAAAIAAIAPRRAHRRERRSAAGLGVSVGIRVGQERQPAVFMIGGVAADCRRWWVSVKIRLPAACAASMVNMIPLTPSLSQAV